MKPVIVIPAYNRPHSLHRLLRSLAKAVYPPDVQLIISVDVGGVHEKAVVQVAKEFTWAHGKKEVVVHERPLGLIDNFLFCGDLTQTYGCTIHLEDDLIVSPAFYAYAQQTAPFYADDPRIAGLSLNALWFNGYTQRPFVPYLDGNDLFFMQVAWFHGQVYTKEQWGNFRQWWEKRIRPEFGKQVCIELGEFLPDERRSMQSLESKKVTHKDIPFHEMFSSFPDTDWFPHKTRYLAETGRYYGFPRVSYATNFGEAGTHFNQQTRLFQTPLQMVYKRLHLLGWEESTAVYDSFQELLPSRLNRLAPQFADYEYTIDLHNNRSRANIRTPYLLTSKQSDQPIWQYGDLLWPLVANVTEEVEGTALCLTQTDDLDWGWQAKLKTEWQNVRYGRRERPFSLRQQMRHWVAKRLR